KAAETSHATPPKTEGKAMGAAIQQPPAELPIQPAVQFPVQPADQMDSVRVEQEIKQDSPREIHREIPEEPPKIEKKPQIASNAVNRITVERRRTQELPLSNDSQFDIPVEAKLDEGLRQAEAQLPEPTHIETEPVAEPDLRITLSHGFEPVHV